MFGFFQKQKRMEYQYYVVFYHSLDNKGHYFGNCEVEIEKGIRNYDDMDLLHKKINENLGEGKVIIGFQKLSGPGKNFRYE